MNDHQSDVESLIEIRVNDLLSQFDEVDSSQFTGTNQWLIRTDGERLWVSVETHGTWFDDDCTLSCGPQQWDRSSFERGEDETDEEYDLRFAEACRPDFPYDAAREFVAKSLDC